MVKSQTKSNATQDRMFYYFIIMIAPCRDMDSPGGQEFAVLGETYLEDVHDVLVQADISFHIHVSGYVMAILGRQIVNPRWLWLGTCV